ncbi:unnamed protein product [Gordionus sp. m RMFG-2023]|uniref:pre-rRNA-processing protein TSR1 homolog n=1 Tax=Gordionus sp. m RMFG-2023 TaxID=3053472 RepID=UPI0030E3ABE8
MAKSNQHKHGPFKQVNKKHKIRFGKNKDKKKSGKFEDISQNTKKSKKLQTRLDKMNQKNQIRKNKLLIMKNEKSNYIGKDVICPIYITVIPLYNTQNNIQVTSIISKLLNFQDDDHVKILKTQKGLHYINYSKLKSKFCLQFLSNTDKGLSNLFHSLDLAKISDVLLFLLPPVRKNIQSVINDTDTNLLECIISQGLPNSYFIYDNDENDDALSYKSSSYIDSYKKGFAKLYHEMLHKYVPNPEILHASKICSDSFLRQIAYQKRKTVHWLSERPLMMADHIQIIQNHDTETATVKLSGFLKNMEKPFVADQLVHIPTWVSQDSLQGDFRIGQVDHISPDPYFDNNNNDTKNKIRKNSVGLSDTMEIADMPTQLNGKEGNIIAYDEIAMIKLLERIKIIGKSDQVKRSLFYNTPQKQDELMEEKTNEDEIIEDDQSTIISNGQPNTLITDAEIVKKSVTFNDEMLEEIDSQINHENGKMEGTNEDAISLNGESFDINPSMQARVRLSKYRGLKSFKESSWQFSDSYPEAFEHLTEFENLKRSTSHGKRFMEEQWKDMLSKCGDLKLGEEHGQTNDKNIRTSSNNSLCNLNPLTSCYFTLTLPEVPLNICEAYQTRVGPLILFGLLPYEQNFSMLNFAIRKSFASTSRHSNLSTSSGSITDLLALGEDVLKQPCKIKSKSKLLFQVGFRRFYNEPIFSDHTLNIDKHKFERYYKLDNNDNYICSMLTNIFMTNVPILVFKPPSKSDNISSDNLLAQGSLFNIDPKRIIVKRAIISGQAYKINGHSVTIRNMFYNTDDINWFKSVQLRTKLGRIGHIKEPVGTHGHMKCVFNATLKSFDTIYLYLYKRIFPKWKQHNFFA